VVHPRRPSCGCPPDGILSERAQATADVGVDSRSGARRDASNQQDTAPTEGVAGTHSARDPYTRKRDYGGRMDDVGAQLALREPQETDGPAMLAAVAASRDLHRPWVSPPADVETFLAWVFRSRRADHASYLACSGQDLVGVVNLNDITRGPLQSAFLGYYGFVPFAGRGWMRRALAMAIGLAFAVHGLHRLEANVQPANERSRRLVAGLGFRLEGYSPRYLRVDGQWRDHERWALLADEWTREGGDQPGGAQAGSRQSTGGAP
jgi:[ribosomal protein S5]-alanine N-acetyltransferase